MKIVNREEFLKIINGDKVVVCDFFANWCGPCKMLAPNLEEAEANFPEAEFIKIDIDKEPELAINYGVMSIPTLIIFRNGDDVEKSVGYMDIDELNEWIEPNL